MATPYIIVPFALAGDVTSVPNGVQPDGTVSMQQGYGPDYSLAQSNPQKLNVERTKQNFLFNLLSTCVQQYQQHGTPDFITTSDNGGTPYSYSKYDRVRYDPGSGPVVYQSLVDTNVDLPTVTTSWGIVSVTNSGIPANAQVGGTYNPVAADEGKIIERSNTTSAMTDQLPGTGAPLGAAWFAYVKNIDTAGVIAYSVGAGGTIGVGNRPTANSFFINPGETWMIIAVTGTANYLAARLATASLNASGLVGSKVGLAGGWVSNTTYNYAADSIVVGDSNGNAKVLTAFNKTLNTAVSGIGGLTSAVAPNTWYAVYAAYNPSTGAVDIFGDVSRTAPTNPGAYPYYAFLGSIRTDGSSNIKGTIKSGDMVQYKVGSNLSVIPLIASGSTGGSYTSASVGSFVPPWSKRISVLIGGGGSSPNTIKFALDAAGTDRLVIDGGPSVSAGAYQVSGDFLLESTTVYYFADTGSGQLMCNGYIE